MSDSVVVAYPYGHIEPRFTKSLVQLLAYDHHRGGHILDAGGFIALQTTNVAHGRNQIVANFLDHYTAEWLWFIDTDMDFQPDTLERLLASAHPKERPIMGALCFALMKGEAQEVVPTLYTVTEHNGSSVPARVMELPEPGIHQVAATGTGCLLIHRSVLEALRTHTPPGAAQPYGETTWPWFRWSEWHTEAGWDVMGEDLTFCFRAGEAGFPTHVDTRIEVGHVKPVVIDSTSFAEQFSKPQRVPRFVVIPMKDKAELTRTLVGQLREQGEYDRLFILDNGSVSKQAKNWLASVDGKDGVEVIPADGWGIHRMWNEGIRRSLSLSPSCDIAILNNDLSVGPEFLSKLSQGLRSADLLGAVCPNYDGRAGSGVVPLRGICAGRYDGTGGLAGFAFMVPGEAFASGFPFFDERLSWYFGDNDLVLSLEKAGAWYGMVTDCSVEHVGGGSQTSGWPPPEPLASAFKTDQDYFASKWNVQVVAA